MFFDVRGIARSRGGNRFPLGDQESVGGYAECGVMMESAPASALVMAKTEFLLEVLVIAFDAPAQLGGVDQEFAAGIGEWSDGQYLVGSASPAGRWIQRHSSDRGVEWR